MSDLERFYSDMLECYVVIASEHDAALAAKDARIGRLEWLLREVRFSTDSIMIQHLIDRALEEGK